MDSLRVSFDQHAFVFWIIFACVLMVAIVWVVVLQMRIRRLQGRLDDFLGGVSGDNTAQLLTQYLATARAAAATVDRMKMQHDQVVSLMPTAVRHVGLVRFSPFHDTGGDQSFALALLDGRRDGIVLTALHSRHDSRLYAKPVEAGSSRYSLTPEEREAMERALGSKAGVAVPS